MVCGLSEQGNKNKTTQWQNPVMISSELLWQMTWFTSMSCMIKHTSWTAALAMDFLMLNWLTVEWRLWRDASFQMVAGVMLCWDQGWLAVSLVNIGQNPTVSLDEEVALYY